MSSKILTGMSRLTFLKTTIFSKVPMFYFWLESCVLSMTLTKIFLIRTKRIINNIWIIVCQISIQDSQNKEYRWGKVTYDRYMISRPRPRFIQGIMRNSNCAGRSTVLIFLCQRGLSAVSLSPHCCIYLFAYKLFIVRSRRRMPGKGRYFNSSSGSPRLASLEKWKKKTPN